MSTTVTFDSTSLQNVNKVVRTAKHDSAPDREMEILPLARNEGGVFVSEHYQSKVITIDGIIKASSKANLETEIDSFKELLSRKNKHLDIEYAGGTRRYVAYSRAVNIDRDFFHLNYAPYEVEFIVPAGVGKDTAVTEALDGVSADPTYTGAVTFTGSSIPKPVIKLTFGSGWTDAYGIQFKNTDSNEECIITRSTIFADGDILEIDCENKKVELNDTEIEFYRVFPSFAIATNNIQITAGDIIDEQYTAGLVSVSQAVQGNDYVAQSFTVTHTNATYQGIQLYIRYDSGQVPTEPLVVEIQTDNNNKPSGSEVTNATFSIPVVDVGTSFGWVLANSTNKFTLSANTIYWIVCKSATSSPEIYYIGGSDSNGTYGKGFMKFSSNAGSTWTNYLLDDCNFKLLFGGKADSPAGTLTLDIDYTRRYL